MNAGLIWTAAGSLAGVLAVVLTAWQVRIQHTEHRQRRPAPGERSVPDLGGLPVAAPLGQLPVEVRGRDDLLAELRRPLTRRLRPRGGTWVLAGMGGLGKSTVALAAARVARSQGWRVWWVTATDPTSLGGGMLEVLRQLDAPDSVTRPVLEGAPAAAERAWDFLNSAHAAGRRWLLVFDNADTPAGLAAPGTARPGDYTGWLRPDPAGMVIVTTRIRDPGVWGAGVAFRELRPLDEMTAARVLGDLAPDAGDLAGKDAMRLGRRLGGLPLAVHLAGSYLTSPFARWHSFADYHHALDSVEVPVALADLDDPAAQARATIQRTWGLSLDALEANGQPQARPVLFLLSCYAPATPIPASLLQPEKPATLLTADRELPAAELSDQRARQLRDALRGLASAGLIDTGTSQNGRPAVTVHPVVADANRSLMIGTASPFAGAGATAVAALQERC